MKLQNYSAIVLLIGFRLKIPLLLGSDVIHGYKTTIPIPLGSDSNWDMVGEGFLTTLKRSLDEGKVAEAEIGRDEALTVSVNLKNTGNFDGEEVVQLYLRDVVRSITRQNET